MVSQDTSDLVHTLDSVVRRRHVYKRIWTPTVGEQLQLRPEEDNESDPRAVAILKHGVIVGHLPQRRPELSGRVTRDCACGGKIFRTFNFAFRFFASWK